MSSLDEDALTLFRAGCTQEVTWDDFTDRQKDHWRAVARKAKELHVKAYAEAEYQRVSAAIKNRWERGIVPVGFLYASSALEDAADAAQSDGLSTAAEVIYDLRARAKELRGQTE